jgi:SAM-dependent methyltransferase
MSSSRAHSHDHGDSEFTRDPEFLLLNKKFYLDEEEYDWVAVTDKVRGLESFFHRGRVRSVRRLLRAYGVPPFVDVGCGTGLMLRHLPAGSVGIDINPRNLPKAKRNAPVANVMQADIENAPFKENSISTIVMTEVLEHFPNPSDILAQLKRALKPGGRLIGTVPSQSLIWKLRFLSSSCPAEEPFHKNYDRKQLESLLRAEFPSVKTGLANVSMSIYFVATA